MYLVSGVTGQVPLDGVCESWIRLCGMCVNADVSRW